MVPSTVSRIDFNDWENSREQLKCAGNNDDNMAGHGSVELFPWTNDGRCLDLRRFFAQTRFD